MKSIVLVTIGVYALIIAIISHAIFKKLSIKNTCIIIIIISLIQFSCEPNLVFTEPMPPSKNIEPLQKFPEELIGIFNWEFDQSYFLIDDNIIYQELWYTSVSSIDDIKETESCTILDGGIYHEDLQECIPFEYISENSILSTFVEVDTVFNFSDNEVAKMYKGNLFLNYRNNKNQWTTHILNPNPDGSLTWETLYVPDDRSIDDFIQKYDVELKRDSSYKYIANPTTKEFEKLLENDFGDKLFILYPVNLEEEYPTRQY